MIISPPFLPDRSTLTEEAWLDAAMVQPLSHLTSTRAPEGSFPLSLKLAWHNGLHIQAPQAGGNYLPVRAVADGEVVFVHAPTTPNTDVTHALNYNPFNNGTPSPAWTSDGFVVIRHTTEIGATGTTPTEVTYFSAYMHLSHVANCPKRNAPWKAGDAIYRKDELGAPGQVYGNGGQIHFEICCDEANLRQFVPRGPAWVDPLAPAAPTANGRTDSVFGNMYVYLPAGTPTRTTPPAHHVRAASAAGGPTLQQPQWVQITYETGSATLYSYAISGEPIGTYCNVPNFEYDLYAKATERHNSLDAATQALSSPSGWYELLRFGRNLGPDPLPAHAAHWREIPTATGTVWADLNAPGTFKFSDADFPAFRGWNCFDDDLSPTDQRCDSLRLKTLIRNPDPTDDRRMERAQLALRLGEPAVRTKLRRAICRFPSEWDQRTVVERYSWLLTEDFKPEDDDATGAQKWERFVEHARAISFTNLPADFLRADWRFHPGSFITHMRRCGWLSQFELAQCFPRKLQHLRGTNFHMSEFQWNEAFNRAGTWKIPFNQANRRYGIDNRQRLVHYFSHVIPETGFLKLMKESDNRTGTYLRSKPYYPYYGRGLIQLTWKDAYKNYGKFRGFAITENSSSPYFYAGWNPDALLATSNTIYHDTNCADSAGYYITQTRGMKKQMDASITKADAITVSKFVNGNVAIENLNGLDVRLQSILFLRDALLDMPADSLSEKLDFDWRRNSEQEPTMKNGRMTNAFIKTISPWSINVSLDKQRP